MKKSSILGCALAAILTFGLSSCSDDNNGGTVDFAKQDQQLQAIATQYVNGTVNPTYKELAAGTEKLYNLMVALKNKIKTDPQSVTDAEIEEAANTFEDARSHYEQSEAFLLGAASDFGIDPRIDTWPLDLPTLSNYLNDPANIKVLDVDNADIVFGNIYGTEAASKFDESFYGFHGIEFILFRDGKPRTADMLRADDPDESLHNVSGKNEIIFATAAAGYLRNKCYQMEVAWNKNAPQSHIDKIKELQQLSPNEWKTTVDGTSDSYGDNMLKAGQTGSKYSSWRNLVNTILAGDGSCQDIANEVGNTKMGKPYNSSTEEDRNYIESPYSQRSFYDFMDNIRSIQNVYFGGRENDTRDESKSVHAYIQEYDADLDKQLTDAMENAIQKIDACPKPFVKNKQTPQVQEAINACNNLKNLLIQAGNFISKGTK